MLDFPNFKRAAIRYWERRRLRYNLALIPPTLLGYGSYGEISAAVGDRQYINGYSVLLLFVISAFAANICNTFAYACEFLFGTDSPTSYWNRRGRTIAFICGTLFAMFLAIIGGRNIAILEYFPHRN